MHALRFVSCKDKKRARRKKKGLHWGNQGADCKFPNFFLTVPEKWPDNFRGVPGKAEELTIAWTVRNIIFNSIL